MNCIEWQGWCDRDGYGRLGRRINGQRRQFLVHRLMWQLTNNRPIPGGMVVMHTCDNPPCVNPAHLRLGTPLDNVRDRDAKGRTARHDRWQGPRLFGESHSQAKLTEDAVQSIRSRAEAADRRSALAREFGVSKSLIDQIVNRKIWIHC